MGQITLGIVLSILSALLFTGMDAFVKVLDNLGTGELTFLRGVIGLAFIPLVLRKEKGPLFSGKDHWLLHARGFFGGLGICSFFFALKGMTLGDAQILGQLTGFFLCVLSPIFLKTKVSKDFIPAIVGIILGTAIVMQVWNFNTFNAYAWGAIACSFFSACAYTCIGKLNENGGHAGTEIVFYFQMYSILCGGALMIFDFIIPQGIDWVFLVGLSFCAIFAQMSLTWGCLYISPLLVSFLQYTAILFHIIVGWMFWGEVLTIYSWIGGAFIVLGSGMLLWKSRKA